MNVYKPIKVGTRQLLSKRTRERIGMLKTNLELDLLKVIYMERKFYSLFFESQWTCIMQV